MMFSYVKSLIALGLAIVVILGLAFWYQRLSGNAASLRQQKREWDRQVEEAQAYPQIIAALEQRLRTLKDDIDGMAGRFADKDNPGPQLVTTVVRAAGAAGMEMVRTTGDVSPDRATRSRLAPSPDVVVVSYEFGLRGPYSSLVLFLQNMASWTLAHKMESMEITCPEESDPKQHVDVTLVLSVFSSPRLNTRRVAPLTP